MSGSAKTSRKASEDETPRVGPILGGDGTATGVAVMQRGNEQLTTPANEGTTQRVGLQTLQLTDEDIAAAQKKSRLVQRLVSAGEHKGMKIETRHGLVLINTANGRRVVFPPELWPVVFKKVTTPCGQDT